MQEIREFIRPYRKSGDGEGSINNVQAYWLWRWCEDNKPKRILEIGFNAGISTEVFLRACDAEVISFDLLIHPYCEIRVDQVKRAFPGRFTLIQGDSKTTIPEHEADDLYDLIFIDGDHRFEGAKADIENCHQLAHEFTALIIDDYRYSDIITAINHCLESGIIRKGHEIICPITGKKWYVTTYVKP